MEQINQDLAVHFNKRLRQLIHDTGSVMDAADIDEQEITRLILIGLMHEIMCGMISLQLDEIEILKLTSKSYHEVWRALRRTEEMKKATAKK